MAPGHMGFAVLCDATGDIKSVLVATEADHLHVRESKGLEQTFLPEDREKLAALLGAAADTGSALGWELRAHTPAGNEPLSVNAVRTGEGILLVATCAEPQVLSMLEDVVRMNSELVNAVRRLQKQSGSASRNSAGTEMDDLSRLNNELVNLQRELAQKNAELERSEKLVSSIIDLAPVLVYLLDVRTGAPTFANNALQDIMQHPFDSPTESVRQLFTTLIDPEHASRRADSLAKLQQSSDNRAVEWSFRASVADGEARWLRARETVFSRSADGRASQLLGIVQDVTDSHRTAELATELAHTDSLTGLSNHRGLAALCGVAVARSARTGEPIGVLFADLNGLKQINDRHGHAAGDEAIIRFATALKSVARESDITARVGGDEFVVVLSEGAGTGVVQLPQRIHAKLQSMEGESIYALAAAVGTALGQVSTMSALDELIERADADMYTRKEASKAGGVVKPGDSSVDAQ